MAHMYPETLDGLEVKSHAEVDLFRAFQQQLSDQYYVLHSVAWLDKRRSGSTPVDGEADFVILHPTRGVLIVEVKGGTVGFDEDTGWYSIRKNDGIPVDIKNPFEQAKNNKYALLRKIDSLPNWQGPVPTIGHAVAFPDGSLDLPDMGVESARGIVLLHEDMGNLAEWVKECMAFWSGDHFIALGDRGVNALLKLLRRSWQMREPNLGEEIGVEARAIHSYTEDQMRMLDLLTQHRQAAIRGCAGSGKTTLAIQKAQRLASEGFVTLLTCYNRNLANEINLMKGHPARLKASGFHALCQEFAHQTGRDKKPDWNDRHSDFFDVTMPDALAEAAATNDFRYRFDAIIVDEGQDFDETWLLALKMLLKNPENDVFYVFYDDNQLVYKRRLNLPVQALPYALTTNCRNTKRIHQAVVQFYHSDLKLTVRGPEGRPVNLRTYQDTPTDLRACLTEVLAQLVFAEKVKPSDIVVLSPDGPECAPLARMANPGVFRLVPTRLTSGDDIYCTTIRLFKGLESPVVIVIIPERLEDRQELLYVGLSRASSHIEILASQKLEAEIAGKLKGLNIVNR